MQKKKILTSVNLTPETKEMVDNFKSLTNTSYSIAAENLIIKGLENLEQAEKIIEIQKLANKKLNESIKNIEKRFESTLFKILKTTATIEGYTFFVGQGKHLEDQQLKTVSDTYVKKAFASLRNGEDNFED